MGRRGPGRGAQYSCPFNEAVSDILVARLDEYMSEKERRVKRLREELARLRAAPFSRVPIYTLAWYEREIERLEASK